MMSAQADELLRMSVEYVLSIGFKHVDCPATADGEVAVREGIVANINAAMRRSELFVTAKLGNSDHHSKNVVLALRQTLKHLHLSRVYLFLVHWPFAARGKMVALLDTCAPWSRRCARDSPRTSD